MEYPTAAFFYFGSQIIAERLKSQETIAILTPISDGKVWTMLPKTTATTVSKPSFIP